MKKILGLAAGLTLAAIAAPSLAQAQNAYTTDYVNLRAGPGLEYPVVFEVPQGQPLQSYGCLDGYSWCDVSVDGYRGWIAGEFVAYAYGGSYVPLYVYGPRFHVPIISFSFVTYWDTHYRHYRWYSYRDRWSHYDWRNRRWDDDRWRQWAHSNRNEWDRWDGRRDGDRDGRNGGWNGRTNTDRRDGDRDGRNGGWNGRTDNDRRDGDRDGRNGGWNGRTDNDRRDGDRDGRNGGWNGRGDNDRNDGDRNGRTGGWNGRSDNDRRPGAPVRDPATGGVHATDPAVHSGGTTTHTDGTRFGNPQRWGNSSYKPDSVNYGNSNRRFDNNVGRSTDRGNDKVQRFEPRKDYQVNTRTNTHVDQPRVITPRNDQPRVNADRATKRNDTQVNTRNDNRSKVDADRGNTRSQQNNNRRNDKNDKRDGTDGRS
jgi:uncharacterized protein YraI